MSLIDPTAAINYVLGNEGLLVDNPQDPGGITFAGISLRFLKSLTAEELKECEIFDLEITADTILHLDIEKARLIYLKIWWERCNLDGIFRQTIASFIFDMCINHGISPAIKMVQRACWAVVKDRNTIKDDGVLGPKTLSAINQCGFYLLPVLRSERASFYRMLAEKDANFNVFLNGWLNRAYRN